MLLWTAVDARADDGVAAQALFDQARKAVTAHNFAEACPKLEESLRLQEALGTLLNLADCYEQEGKLASAWSRFLEVASKARAAGQTARARIGKERAAALAPKLSNLVIEVPAASRLERIEVRRDGTLVGEAEWGAPIPIDAGTHTVKVSAPGRKSWSGTIAVTGGAATARVVVPLLDALPATPAAPAPVSSAPPPPPPPHDGLAASPSSGSGSSGLRVAAWVVGGIGVVGLGTGAAFGLVSLSKHNDAAKACPTANTCSSRTGVDLWSEAFNWGNASTATFIGGGAFLAAGAVLFLVAPKPASGSGRAGITRVALGPGSLGVGGVW
jgi:hypothetical protein